MKTIKTLKSNIRETRVVDGWTYVLVGNGPEDEWPEWHELQSKKDKRFKYVETTPLVEYLREWNKVTDESDTFSDDWSSASVNGWDTVVENGIATAFGKDSFETECIAAGFSLSTLRSLQDK